MSEQLVDSKAAAKRLGVAEQTLALWRSTGRYNLPYVKLGRAVRYSPSDLDAFVRQGRVEPQSGVPAR